MSATHIGIASGDTMPESCAVRSHFAACVPRRSMTRSKSNMGPRFLEGALREPHSSRGRRGGSSLDGPDRDAIFEAMTAHHCLKASYRACLVPSITCPGGRIRHVPDAGPKQRSMCSEAGTRLVFSDRIERTAKKVWSPAVCPDRPQVSQMRPGGLIRR